MTVKQLRAKLEKMPQDAEVEYYDGDNGWTIIDSVNHEDNIRSYIQSNNPRTSPANVVVLSEW